ncbi:MAG: AsnC family transcriptional regulator [Candidatus Brocadiia bacterium]
MDRKLLDRLQAGFPLADRPYAELGAELGLDEAEALARVRRLADAGLIRRIGPVVDPHRLGRVGTLVAAAVPRERLAEVAAPISACQGVSHSYLRRPRRGQCPYNLWFTLSAESPEALQATLQRLARETGLDLHSLPSRRKFKLAVRFRFSEAEDPGAGPAAHRLPQGDGQECGPDELDRHVLRATQDGLPLEPQPYAPPAEVLGLETATLLARLRAMLSRGVVRRVAASIAHRNAGFRANLMCVWRVEPDQVESFGREAAAWPQVTHCYERKTAPRWPYNVYAMVHGRDMSEAEAVVDAICRRTGRDDCVVLESTRELKKTWTRI